MTEHVQLADGKDGWRCSSCGRIWQSLEACDYCCLDRD